MSALKDPRLPKGTTILITGVTGYIGSHVADQALAAGYKVRGGVRSEERAAWLTSYFEAKYGNGAFSTAVVKDALDIAAVKSAVDGVDGIIDIAVDSQLSASPEPYIPNTIRRTINVLEAAAQNPQVKAVVITSSSMAGVEWTSDVEYQISPDSYNETFIKLAWNQEYKEDGKMWVVYAAAKAQSEQAAWKFMQEQKPAFVINTVLPSCNFGPALVPDHQGLPSTGGFVKNLFEGDTTTLKGIAAQFFIDVRDSARLHVAALVNSDAVGERFWGFAEPYNWNQVLTILRKLYPERKFIDDLDGVGEDKSTPPSKSAEAQLKFFGQDSWTPLEQSIKESLASIGC